MSHHAWFLKTLYGVKEVSRKKSPHKHDSICVKTHCGRKVLTRGWGKGAKKGATTKGFSSGNDANTLELSTGDQYMV